MTPTMTSRIVASNANATAGRPAVSASIADVLTAQHLDSGRRGCWAPHLRDEFDRPYMRRLRLYLADEASEHQLLPKLDCIFEVLDETTLDEVKVVIIGQDPYAETGQAHGLAFSAAHSERPQSLCKILREVERNMNQPKRAVPKDHNCLTPWARQGVLLLNRVLTVRKGCPGSHRGKGWEGFTNRIVETVNMRCEHVVFMLWGELAKGIPPINEACHKILYWRHPRVGLLGSQHFSQANQYLEAHHAEPIDWLDVCKQPPSDERDAVGALTSDDAVDEARWDRAFANSIPQLEQLAAEAAQERASGRTEELDPSRL